MPSPFPGMDPYLEERTLWGSVHHRLISAISDALTPQMTPHFFVGIEERGYIISPEDEGGETIFPAAYLVQHPRAGASITLTAQRAPTEPTIVVALAPVEVRDRYIEIREARGQEVVTTIEVLSPRNKATRSRGRQAFLKKRQTVLTSKTSWIEIDLLRGGERPAEVAGQSDYYALLKRRGPGDQFAVWYVDLYDPPSRALSRRPARPRSRCGRGLCARHLRPPDRLHPATAATSALSGRPGPGRAADSGMARQPDGDTLIVYVPRPGEWSRVSSVRRDQHLGGALTFAEQFELAADVEAHRHEGAHHGLDLLVDAQPFELDAEQLGNPAHTRLALRVGAQTGGEP